MTIKIQKKTKTNIRPQKATNKRSPNRMKAIILAIAMTLTATTGGENITVTLCDQAKTGRIFEIKDTLECKKSKVEKIEKCWGDIYDPNIKRIPITAYKCTKIVDTYKSYWYFLGYKKHTMLGTATRGVSPQECRRWASLKQAAGIGKLRSTETDIFKTIDSFCLSNAKLLFCILVVSVRHPITY